MVVEEVGFYIKFYFFCMFWFQVRVINYVIDGKVIGVVEGKQDIILLVIVYV